MIVCAQCSCNIDRNEKHMIQGMVEDLKYYHFKCWLQIADKKDIDDHFARIALSERIKQYCKQQ